MSIWLQTPIRQVEARLEARLQHLLQLLAWAADNGVPPQDALRSMRASWGVLAVQMILGIGWIGGPLAIFLGPLRKINLAVIKLEKDLAGGVPLAEAMSDRLSPFLRSSWLAMLRRAEAGGQLTQALSWISQQPGLCRPFYQSLLARLVIFGMPMALCLPVIFLLWVFILPNFVKMGQEMGSKIIWQVPRLRLPWMHELPEEGVFLIFLIAAVLALVILTRRSFGLWAESLMVHLPWLGRLSRWQCQREAAQAVAWSLAHEPRLELALELAADGSEFGWLRSRVKRASTAIAAGTDWLAAWQSAGLVDTGDFWLLRQGHRLQQPGAACATLAMVLAERLNHARNLRLLWLRMGLTLLNGALVLAITLFCFTILLSALEAIMQYGS